MGITDAEITAKYGKWKDKAWRRNFHAGYRDAIERGYRSTSLQGWPGYFQVAESTSNLLRISGK